MTTAVVVETTYEEPEPPLLAWGWYLAFGIAWIVIGLAVLSWNPTTIALISILVSVVVILAGIMELVEAFGDPGWRWLHGAAGIVFLIVGAAAFFDPFRTFAGLALLFGWFLVIQGSVMLIVSLATRVPGTLWGLAAVLGVLEIAIGVWAIGVPSRSAWLLVLWIGIGAFLHGIGDIIGAFHVRAAR
jgi:uncharacterized membrane protein HdeD (DUF308 family)